MNFYYFFSILKKRKFLILGAALFAMVGTFLVISKTSKKYVSKSQLETGIANKDEVSLSEHGSDFFSISNEFNNLIEQITSKQVISLLSYKLALYDLDHKYTFREMGKIKEKYSAEDLNKARLFFSKKSDAIQAMNNSEDSERLYLDLLKDMEYDNKSIERDLEIFRVGSTDYIEIKYTSKNPYLSAFVVNTLCDEIIRFYSHATQKKMDKSVQFFSELASQKKKELDAKLDSLNRFKRVNSVTNYEEESKSKLDQISSLESARDEANKTILALQQSLQTLDSKLNAGQNEDFDTEYNNNKTLNIRNKISNLTDRYINQGSKDKKLKDSIQVLKDQLNYHLEKSDSYNTLKPNISKQELNSKKINTELELGTARSNLATIERNLSQLRGNLSGFSVNEAAISELQMAITVAKDEYIAINDKFNSSKNVSLNSGQLHQVEFGEPADEPEPTKAPLLTILAGFMVTLMCAAYLFLIEYLSDKIKTPSTAADITEKPLLGIFNKLKETGINLEKVDLEKEKETFKYLLRKTRHQIENSGFKIILFCSINGNEGKSFILVQLAKSLGLNGKNVLIIDTQFKNPTLTEQFKAKAIIGRHIVEEEYKNSVQPTGLLNVDIIGCLKSSASPNELFSNGNFQHILINWASSYDYIFMESAPLNKYADGYELAVYADMVVPILSSEVPLKLKDKDILNYFNSDDKSYKGAILNQVNLDNINL